GRAADRLDPRSRVGRAGPRDSPPRRTWFRNQQLRPPGTHPRRGFPCGDHAAANLTGGDVVRIAWAFVRRDWYRQTSYRLFSVGQVVQMLVLVGVIYLIGSAVAGVAGFKVGLEYVRFLLVGIACADI